MPDRWDALAALVDRSRRALYDYVRRQDHPVSREEAADAERMSRNLAAFHLDKLVEAGLLRSRYEAPADQPRGRGRTPKVYSPADDGVSVSIPERQYRLIAEILADAVAEDPTNAEQAAVRIARDRGRELGTQLFGAEVRDALAGLGFEPRTEGDRVLLDNCPFHALAARRTALVCGLNHAFVGGLLDAAGADGLRAELVPRPGACCVEVGAVAPRTDPG